MAKTKAAGAAKTEEVQLDTVTVERKTLERLVKLAEDLESADNAYKNCQATIYRSYVQGLYKAGNTRMAVAQAKEALGT